ncbi:MAG: ATP-binding protein, partial [Thermoguttaceae bacterium]
GCTLFYLDSFGADLEHVKLMRFLRARMGRKILTFTEHQCDAILPYSGGYSETTARAAGPEYQVWSGVENWRIYQWLAPGAQLVSRLYQVEGQMPKDFEPVDEFFYRHGITPLVPVSDFARLAQIGAIQAKHLPPPAGRATEKDEKVDSRSRLPDGTDRRGTQAEKGERSEKGEKGAKGAKGESDLAKLAATWKTRADWTARGATIRQGILQAAGLVPLPVKSPLRPRVHSLRQHPGYSVANVAFESVPGFFVTGNLYRPLEQEKGDSPHLCDDHASMVPASGPCRQMGTVPFFCPDDGSAPWITITVADSGPGIPQNLGDQIFAPYVSTKDTGLGLGLAICRQIVQLHGGQITAHNAPEGGALFTVRLPRLP